MTKKINAGNIMLEHFRDIRPKKVPSYVKKEENERAIDHVYTPEEMEFIKAMDLYKREKRRPFPTLREILKVLKSLGYSKGGA